MIFVSHKFRFNNGSRSAYVKYKVSLSIHLIFIFILVMVSNVHANKGVYDWANVKLDCARQEKVKQLKDFCDRTHALALQAAHDQFMIAFFDINLQYSEAESKGSVPKDLALKIAELREGFNQYYIKNYFAFYDILFVNTQGNVFYTLRKESDFHADLFQGNLAKSALARSLKKMPQKEVFVDFQYWQPSSEPAAFFIEPINKDRTLKGWIILQWAINKLDTLLAWTESLGQTGETFLVNQEGYMLTESNFEGSSTIMKKRLDDRNIQAKFVDKQGHRTVTDYRGFIALSSFQVVQFLETQWLVVAKVDRAEIITDHYVQHRQYYEDKIKAYLKESPPNTIRGMSPNTSGESIRVDMDEFIKADKGERLHTFGVSTCTALLATYPGKFAYMAHISPRDRVYGADGTNLLGQMVKKIKSFDIYRCERRKVLFVLAAIHLESLFATVDKLVEEGFLLSQIKVIYNPKAASAAMSYDYKKNNLQVVWHLKGNPNTKTLHLMEDANNIGKIVRKVMDREEAETMNKTQSNKGEIRRSAKR